MRAWNRRGCICIPAVLCALTVTAAAGAAPAVPPVQRLTVLLRAHTAVTAIGDHGLPVQVIAERRPITEARTVLPVIARATGPRGTRWLRVLLPGRPNGRSGWIKQSGTRSALSTWRIVVRLDSRLVLVYRHGRLRARFPAIVGAPATPTPRGTFFVEESIALDARDVGAPFALALSARSDVLQEFAGGPGQIALHGLMHVGGVLGTAASHGCVRLPNSAMDWLVRRVGPGAPVTIRG